MQVALVCTPVIEASSESFELHIRPESLKASGLKFQTKYWPES